MNGEVMQTTPPPDAVHDAAEIGPPPIPPRPRRGRCRGVLVGVCAGLIALGYWAWQSARVEWTRWTAEQRQALMGLGDDIAALEERKAVMERTLADQGNGLLALRRAVQARDVDQDRRGGLRHALPLVALAAERLNLARDHAGARAALAAADTALAHSSDARSMALRRAIGTDLEVLAAFKEPDRAALTLELQRLGGLIERMPLRRPVLSAAPAVAPPGQSGWRRLAASIGEALGQLVVVRRHQPAAPSLMPDEGLLIRRSAQLQIAMARAALLQHDGTAYHAAVSDVRRWVDAYFDTALPAVRSALRVLSGLAEVNPFPALPALTSPQVAGEVEMPQPTDHAAPPAP